MQSPGTKQLILLLLWGAASSGVYHAIWLRCFIDDSLIVVTSSFFDLVKNSVPCLRAIHSTLKKSFKHHENTSIFEAAHRRFSVAISFQALIRVHARRYFHIFIGFDVQNIQNRLPHEADGSSIKSEPRTSITNETAMG